MVVFPEEASLMLPAHSGPPGPDSREGLGVSDLP